MTKCDISDVTSFRNANSAATTRITMTIPITMIHAHATPGWCWMTAGSAAPGVVRRITMSGVTLSRITCSNQR